MKCLPIRRFAILLVSLSALMSIENRAQATPLPFTVGDLAVFQADSASANNTTFTIVEVSATGSGLVQNIPINGTSGSSALRTSGSATSTGYLALTNDRTLLSFDAHNSTTSSGNANTILPRGVGTLDANTNFNLATTYTGVSGEQARDATSLDNNAWYISDQSEIYTNGATSPSPAANTRGIKSFGGTVYALQQSSTATNIVVSTVSAPSGGSLTGLPGLTNNNTAVDFYMLSSGNNGVGVYDELYLSTTTGISKFSLVSGSWVANSSAAVTGGLFGLAAALDPLGGEDLYATTGGGATAANSVVKFVDSAGWNQNINVGTATTLFTAPAGTTDKGIDFVPVPEPSTLVLAGLGFIGLAVSGRRLRRQV